MELRLMKDRELDECILGVRNSTVMLNVVRNDVNIMQKTFSVRKF